MWILVYHSEVLECHTSVDGSQGYPGIATLGGTPRDVLGYHSGAGHPEMPHWGWDCVWILRDVLGTLREVGLS